MMHNVTSIAENIFIEGIAYLKNEHNKRKVKIMEVTKAKHNESTEEWLAAQIDHIKRVRVNLEKTEKKSEGYSEVTYIPGEEETNIHREGNIIEPAAKFHIFHSIFMRVVGSQIND